MAEHGIVPGANIYHAEVGSVIGKKLGKIDEKIMLNQRINENLSE